MSTIDWRTATDGGEPVEFPGTDLAAVNTELCGRVSQDGHSEVTGVDALYNAEL